jgi:hypothetical protein
MQPIKAFVARHPIAAYFTLTFTLSWGGVLSTIAGPAGMTGVKAQDHPLFPFAVVAMLAGPSLASLVLTRLIDGTSGLRDLRARLLNWRASARWYGIALLAAPLLAAGVTPCPFSLLSSSQRSSSRMTERPLFSSASWWPWQRASSRNSAGRDLRSPG